MAFAIKMLVSFLAFHTQKCFVMQMSFSDEQCLSCTHLFLLLVILLKNVSSQGEVFALVDRADSQGEKKRGCLSYVWEAGKWTKELTTDSPGLSSPYLIAV